jgi:hypothetical protein
MTASGSAQTMTARTCPFSVPEAGPTAYLNDLHCPLDGAIALCRKRMRATIRLSLSGLIGSEGF